MTKNTPSGALSAADYLRKILLAPVYEVASVTELTYCNQLSKRLNNAVLLKREDLQPVFSFKLRGAYNKIASLSTEARLKGVICASAGNHAQGVALSGSKLGIKTIIVMPRTTPEIKVNAVRNLGGEVVLWGSSFDEANTHAQLLAEQHDYSYVPPFDDADVIAGQGTVAQELLNQDRRIDAVYLPVGGGGLAAGVAVYLKQLRPDIRVIAVESEDSACLAAALAAKEPVTLAKVGLFADGVAVKRIGSETFRLCQAYIDEVITVSSDEICAAVKDIFEDTRAIAEPSGALALAGMKKHIEQQQLQNKRLVAVLSGANTNFHSLRYISERCELGEQREAVFAVTIPEQKGAFLSFCQAIEGRAITEFNYRCSSGQRANIFVGLRVSGSDERRLLAEQLREQGYQVADLSEDETAKLHVRYMVGGRAPAQLTEQLYSFEFPEHPGALLKFLQTLGQQWNITLFHYRNHGAAYGRVLAGFECPQHDEKLLESYLDKLGYQWKDETQSTGYQFFLASDHQP